MDGALLDLLLAIAHHFLAFVLAGSIASELVLLRRGVRPEDLKLLGRVDAVYGGSAGLLVIVGICRVVLGLKGWEFYVYNPTFWVKVTCFIVVGAMSSVPTVRIRQWQKTGVAVSDVEVDKVRTWLRSQAIFFAFIIIFAAAMARGY